MKYKFIFYKALFSASSSSLLKLPKNPRSTFDLAVHLAGNLIHHDGRDLILRNVWLACGRSSVSYAAIPGQKLCRTKRNRTNGYLEQRKVKYTHYELQKLAMFDATCFEFGTCLAPISAQHHKNVPSTCYPCCGFRI